MDAQSKRLQPFLGQWTMEATFPGAAPMSGGCVEFSWMPGEHFLIQRWEIPVPEAPDGLAIIGWDEDRATFLQHYFDSRGIARVYEMTLDNGLWTLTRNTTDFSPLDFAQRFSGRFSDDGNTIAGRWEIAHDLTTFEHDFDLSYLRMG